MKISLLVLVLLCPFTETWAQLDPPNEAGVSFAQFHTIVRDVDASRKFWVTLGGTPLEIDGTEAVRLPGVFVFPTRGSPVGGSFGSVVNHFKFIVPDVDEAVAKWKARGDIAEVVHSEYAGNLIGWAYTPDNLKIRFNHDKSLTVPIARTGHPVLDRRIGCAGGAGLVHKDFWRQNG